MSGRFPAEEITPEVDQRAILVGVDRGRDDWPIDESLSELSRLADTAGAEVVGTVTQKLDRPNPRTFVGAGKAQEIADRARESHSTLVIFDDDMTPSQQKNLEDLIPGTTILDRTALILDIFAQHATTREGKLQVELAKLEYVLPRLRGMWGHLEAERLGGGRGARFGAGESQLETDRRLTRRRIGELKRELRHVAGERDLQRKARARSGVYRVALVGYTNAGKSTLLNALTGADVLAYDKLFATLDSTTRRTEIPEGREVTITDTVGFINKLPHGLVEAFKSTLDEVREADLLLHVTDAAHSQREQQMQAVTEVLAEIGASGKPHILVFNKSELLSEQDRAVLQAKYPRAVFLSALRGTGLQALRDRIAEEAARGSVTLTALVPYTRGDLIRLAHDRAQILSERHTEHGTSIVVRLPAELVPKFGQFALEGEQPEEGGSSRDDAHSD